jgi:hypothetical protein
LSFEVADGFAASESNIIADVKRGGRYDTSGIEGGGDLTNVGLVEVMELKI